MDVYRLNKTNFVPDLLIEGGDYGYDSMIWTERYLENGEFELKTPYVKRTLAQLPEGALLSHRDTREVMLVESRLITTTDDGDILTVKGRSLTSFVDYRYLEGPYPKKKYKMARQYQAHDAALVLLWNCFVNTTTNDATRPGDNALRDILDTVPDTCVTDSTNFNGVVRKRWLTGGQMGPQLRSLLDEENVGFRTIRPNTGTAKVVSITKSDLADDNGIVTRTTDDNVTKLRWDIYNGQDRRRQGPSPKEVIFNYDSGHIEDPTYLYSIENYNTMAFVISETGVKKYYRDRPEDAPKSGLDRRVIWVDGGEVETKKVPQKKASNETQAEFETRRDNIIDENEAAREDFRDDLDRAGKSALKKSDRVLLMDGKVSPDCPHKYKVHYDLGDSVTLVGRYDFDQTMRVSEYVRTDDAEGDRGFPGLVRNFDSP